LDNEFKETLDLQMIFLLIISNIDQ